MGILQNEQQNLGAVVRLAFICCLYGTMTTYLINTFAKHSKSTILPKPGDLEQGCTFCDIIAGIQPCYQVYEDESCLAFLDILPIRPGHLLVVPKQHFARVSHLPDNLAAAIGSVLPRISRALCRAMEQPDYNIVSNQGYAQVVDHVHFHLVPAPKYDIPKPTVSQLGFLGREELTDEDGESISQRIRAEIKKEKAKL